MKRQISLVLILSLMISISILPSFAESTNNEARMIVLFENGDDFTRAEQALYKSGILSESFRVLNGMVVHANEKALTHVIGSSGIVSIEVDQIISMLPKKEKPGKPGGDTVEPTPQVKDWGIDAINATGVWGAYTGTGVKVAVIDTGIDVNHPDLIVRGGVNFVAKAKSYNDDNGHGTHVAGTIAALNNSEGVIGVAYGADLYAVKALDRRGSGYLSDVIRGLEWSVENQMDVVNLSLGSNNPSVSFENALEYAKDMGVIVVAAAGNDGSAVDYPGAYLNTIAVGAIDVNLDLAYFSSIGPEVDVVAPGVNIYSTYKSGAYRSLNGTSMATPHVAGIAAIYKQKYPGTNLDDFRNALRNGSRDLGESGFDYLYGSGLPNLVEVIK